MSIDVTAKHAFSYGGGPILMADEHTMVFASGNLLTFTSTVTHAQHFLVRNKSRKILAFDYNWKKSEFAITSRDVNPEILIYSYPEKKLRGKLQNGAAFEYSHLKFSRCGRRLVSIRADQEKEVSFVARVISNATCSDIKQFASVWDTERCELIRGCTTELEVDSVRFVSFDPSNFDQFVVGGDKGIQIWKIYKGRDLYMLRSVSVTREEKEKLAAPTGSGGLPSETDLKAERNQFICHSWTKGGKFYAANQAGELLLIDAATGHVLQVVENAMRPNGVLISSILSTSEFLVVTYADGDIYWLSERDHELLQTTSLPEGPRGKEYDSIITMAPSPSYSKAYIGTTTGMIYEIKTSVELREEVEEDDEQDGSDEATLVSVCGSYHSSAVFSGTTLTPYGGAYANDALIVTGGMSGVIYFWSISKCRVVAGVNLVTLFSNGPVTFDASGLSATQRVFNRGDKQSPMVTCVASRMADPVLALGDEKGKVRIICVAKNVSTGSLELVPLHSNQILESSIDLLQFHPTQPFLLVASTFDNIVFVLSLNHEKHFRVLSYFALPNTEEKVLDTRWTAETNSIETEPLSFVCTSSTGHMYVCKFASPSLADDELPMKILAVSVGWSKELAKKCSTIGVLEAVPSNIVMGTASSSRDMILVKYPSLPSEETALIVKSLVQDAHEQGITCSAHYSYLPNDEALIATGDMNGVVSLWLLSSGNKGKSSELEDIQAVKKKSVVLHAGAITSLFFLPFQGELYIVSTGIDSGVAVASVRLPMEMKSKSKEEKMNSLYANITSFAKYDDSFKPGQESNQPFLQVLQEQQEANARNRFDREKDKIRAPLTDLETKLRALLQENEQLPADEQLQREEFVINEQWRDKVVAANRDRSKRVRESITKDVAKMKIVRERMKKEFWDSALVKGLKLFPFQTGSFAYNFPMRKLTKRQVDLEKKTHLLRLVEFQHLEMEQAEAIGASAKTKESCLVSRFAEVIPSNVQWMISAGIHHPALHRWMEKYKATSPTATPGLGFPAASFNQIKSFLLVYHPAAIRTRKQQRIQIQLIQAFERFLLSEFNNEFSELVKLKESKMEEIEAKNTRIQEICQELGIQWDYFRPTWHPAENANSILEVKPEEMTQKPYETEAMRKKREDEIAERLEMERQRQKDDVAGRALHDMMDGTLETKKENAIQQTLVKEQWMLETPLDEMTSEQRKLLQQFEAAEQKLLEEKEKYRKSLDLELKKLKAEITEICKNFDEKVKALQETYFATHMNVLVQQLYQLRLAEDLMEHEHLVLERQELQKSIAALETCIRSKEKQNEQFVLQVEFCKEEWQRVLEEDKLLEKNFPKDLEEALGVPAMDHELLKHLLDLYKKRKADDLVRDKQQKLKNNNKAGNNASPGKTRPTSTTGDGLNLLPAALLQSFQNAPNASESLEAEQNLDPFQGVEMDTRRSELKRVAPLDIEIDRPDGVTIDETTWRVLNELRARKIQSEHRVKEKAEHLSYTRSVYEEMKAKTNELAVTFEHQTRQLEEINKRLTAITENAPILVHIKQGQDETSHEDVFAGSQDALLVSRSAVESLNEVILLHGKDQVGILGKIKNFRKNINIMEWEHSLLDLQAKDLEEQYTDIQLLRVTKELQELFHTGDTSEKQKKEIALREAQLVHLGKQHQSNLLKLEKANQKLQHQLRERERENQTFQEQLEKLEMQVQIREDILSSRKSAALRNTSSTTSDSSSARLKAIAVRRKLVDLAKSQTDEIEVLRQELEKMRRRTFPTFANTQPLH